MGENGYGLLASWAEQRQVPGYSIETLNSLSAPKGVRFVCELTGGPAGVKLVTPFLSLYFCSKQDAVLSWEGILHKLLPLLAQLRSKPSIIGSEEEREKREYSVLMSKRALIDLTRTAATKFLVQGQFMLGIPGAVQSLAFSKEVYGEDAVELVPAYLLLARCNLGLGNLRPTQEYLGLANWIVLKSPAAPPSARSELHRAFGNLCAAQGKYADSAQHLAKAIFWMSSEKGPEHVETSAGYFHLAAVFDAQHRVEAALALYDKVVDIWYKYLSTVRVAGDAANGLTEPQCDEALQMLQKVLATREQVLGENHIATGEAHYTLGLLRLLKGRDVALAHANIDAAHQVYLQHLGPDHPSTRDVKDLLAVVDAQINQPETKQGDA